MNNWKSGIFVSIAHRPEDGARSSVTGIIDTWLGRLGLSGSAAHWNSLRKLASYPASLARIDSQLAKSGLRSQQGFQVVLRQLASMGYVRLSTSANRPIASLAPISSRFQFAFPAVEAKRKYRLSRFAYLRRDGRGELIMETPKGFSRIFCHRPVGMTVLHALAAGASVKDFGIFKSTERSQLMALFQLLSCGGFIEELFDEDQSAEDIDEAFRQWEFHDLLFHARIRGGRHNDPSGALFPYRGQIEPQPAIKMLPKYLKRIPMFRPNLRRLERKDPPFTKVLESRHSIREHAVLPIDFKTLAEFLYRTSHVRSEVTNDAVSEQYAMRPYPNAGSLYEIELYLAINKCNGLKRGFYYYDARNHSLLLLSNPNAGMETLLESAGACCGVRAVGQPQILITLAARFQRVSWKYRGIAYGLMLKNIGVVQATMNLVACAMNLAFCAIGFGDSDQFSEVSGCDYYREGSIGECILGSMPATTSAKLVSSSC